MFINALYNKITKNVNSIKYLTKNAVLCIIVLEF